MPRIGVGLGLGLRTSSGGGFDPDAQAFFDRVTAAGGTLTTTEKNATNQLVLDMKSASIWTSMKAVYPMVGASAAACAQNLKSSSFTGTFTSGWTFASTGVTGNGTSTYFDTTLSPNTAMNFNSQSYFIYKASVQSATVAEFGVGNSSFNGVFMYLFNGYNTINEYVLDGTFNSTTNAGAYILNRNNSNDKKLFRNGSLFQTITSAATNFTLTNLYLGARNIVGSLQPTNTETRFFSSGDGLTDTQASNFYTAVQTFNQTLNRQVGAQIVSDADAQAYINRVYTAGGTLTNTEANAVNQLTIDMKAANVWTAMKAVYPMVGSSAAACAQNLKSSSFTGTFTSGWTFASTGVTPNGTSAFFNSNFIPSTNGLTYDNNHLSFYSRTSAQSGAIQFYEMGSGNATGNDNLSLFIRRNTDLAGYDSGDFTTNRATFTNTNGQGFYCGTAPTTTSKYFKNGVSQVSKSLSVKSISGVNVYICAFNENNTTTYYSIRECSFASMGLGLSDAQTLAYYTAVQIFQTTLSRAIAP